MSVATRTITRIQDTDDTPELNASTDGYTLLWDNGTSAFVARDAAAVRDDSPLGVLSSLIEAYASGGTTNPLETITGWSFPVGVRQNFRTILIPYFGVSAARLPRSASVTVRENNSTGTLLGSTLLGLDPQTITSLQYMIADFGAEIANAGAVPLWVGIECDAAVAFPICAEVLYPVASGYAQVAYSTACNPLAPIWNLYSIQINAWMEFYREPAQRSTEPNPVAARAIARVLKNSLTLMPGIKVSYSIGMPGLNYPYNTSGPFSGWGQYLGNISTPFDAIGFRLYPFTGSLPTQLLVVVRRMPTDTGQWAAGEMGKWEIIASSGIINLGALTEGAFQKMTVALDRAVSGHCYVDVISNGGMALEVGFGDAPFNQYARYRASAASMFPAFYSFPTARFSPFTLGTADWSNVSLLPLASSGSATVLTPVVAIHLPTNAQNAIRCLEGVETTIYWRNVIRATSRDGTALDAEDFFIDVTCTMGAQMERGWRYTPTAGDAGSTTLSITVYDQTRTTVYATASCTLVTVALSHPASAVSRKLLVIGDSTTNNGKVLAELVNLFDGDTKYTLTLVGTNNGNADDADSGARAVSSESVNGWTFALFDTDTTTDWTELGGTARTGSVFVNAGAFDFAHYLSAESITLGSGDWVFVNLGINDMFGHTTDGAASTAALALSTILARWIASIKAAVSGIRIGVCLTIPAPETQDAFIGYANTQTIMGYTRNRSLFVEDVLANYDTTVSANVYVIPINATLDTRYNFPTTAVPVNARSATTIDQQGGGVHPDDGGYWQIADTYRAFLKAVEA